MEYFRNSIFNFNRKGIPKEKVRAKIFSKDPNELEGEVITTDKYDEAKKRY
jgi:hypothetical protein